MNGVYSFVTTEDAVDVNGVRLTSGEEVRCLQLDRANDRALFRAIEQEGQPLFWMGKRAVNASRATWADGGRRSRLRR